MKKITIFVFMAFLMLSLSYAVKVERQMVPAVDFGEQIEIKFIIDPEGVQSFEFTETIPSRWDVVSWNIEGVPKESIKFSESLLGMFQANTVYKWNFENVQGPLVLSYSVIVKSVGEVRLESVWFYGSELGSESSEMFVRAVGVVCGDGICQSAYGENLFNCPEDCPFKSNSYFWISILLLATIIVISGTIYREFKNKRDGKGRLIQESKTIIPKTVKHPEKTIKLEIKEKTTLAPQFPKFPVFKEKQEIPIKPVKPKAMSKKTKIAKKKTPISKKTATKTRKSSKKIAKKKPAKQKKTKPAVKQDKFYKETLSRLEKIKKELK